MVEYVLKKGKQPSNSLLTALLTRAFGSAGPAQQWPSKCTGRESAGLSLLILSLNAWGGRKGLTLSKGRWNSRRTRKGGRATLKKAPGECSASRKTLRIGELGWPAPKEPPLPKGATETRQERHMRNGS